MFCNRSVGVPPRRRSPVPRSKQDTEDIAAVAVDSSSGSRLKTVYIPPRTEVDSPKAVKQDEGDSNTPPSENSVEEIRHPSDDEILETVRNLLGVARDLLEVAHQQPSQSRVSPTAYVDGSTGSLKRPLPNTGTNILDLSGSMPLHPPFWIATPRHNSEISVSNSRSSATQLSTCKCHASPSPSSSTASSPTTDSSSKIITPIGISTHAVMTGTEDELLYLHDHNVHIGLTHERFSGAENDMSLKHLNDDSSDDAKCNDYDGVNGCANEDVNNRSSDNMDATHP
ncbi:hypothetical protein CspHIS471_0500880 [Cutaneotrichosporon sp. HIS471]|nr:hypothetical protein CspHIS471_0500880 [Cutaneotrichosporon sp. HIS471]